MTALRHFLIALQFFTRIPVTGRLADWVGFSPEMLRASAAYFPVVGVVVGAIVTLLTAALLASLQFWEQQQAYGSQVLFMKTVWPMWPMAWAEATTASVP